MHTINWWFRTCRRSRIVQKGERSCNSKLADCCVDVLSVYIDVKPTLYWILYGLPTIYRINLQSPTTPPLFATHLPVVFHAITCKHDIMCQEIYFHAVYLWKVSRNLGTKRTWFTFDLELIPTLNHAIPSSMSDITLLHKLVPFKDVSMSTGFIHLK